MRESYLVNDIIRGLYGCVKLWRVNVGTVKTADGRRFSTGLPKGFSDLFGILPSRYSKSGCPVPVFIECKVGANKPTDEQTAFLRAQKEIGCAAGVARSVSDAWAIILPFLGEHPERPVSSEDVEKQ